MKQRIIASMVTFNNPIPMLERTISSFLDTKLNVVLVVVDNSSNSEIAKLADKYSATYIDTGENLGFGKAHNIAIDKYADEADYFLILNPDIFVPKDCLETLCSFMDTHVNVPLSAPLIRNEDNSIQYVHKRLPSLTVLFGRRFLPGSLQKLIQKEMDLYVLKDQDLSKDLNVPILSGCFMFFRSSQLKKLGGFDPRFFMYMEDFDITRRAAELGPTVFTPSTHVVHTWERGGHKSLKLTLVLIISTLKYFIKWGLSRKVDVKRFVD